MIVGPAEVAATNTSQEYRELQRQFLARHRPGVKPAVSTDTVIPRQERTAVRAKCHCGAWMIVAEHLAEACCLNCGAIYESVPAAIGDE